MFPANGVSFFEIVHFRTYIWYFRPSDNMIIHELSTYSSPDVAAL